MKTDPLHQQMTRRQALGAAVHAVAAGTFTALWAKPDAAAEPASAQTDSVPKPQLTLGISTMGFSGFTTAELARELAAAGFHTIQLFLTQADSNFWRYNSRADVSALTPERCRAITQAYRAAGLRIHSLGVYTNLIHPDPAERAANLDYFEAMMEVGRCMGVRVFITEAGHFHDPTKPEPAVPWHFQDAVWAQTVATVRELARRAERFDATILLEPFYRGFLASAKRTRVFLQEVNSPRIRALLDPANLIEVNDLEEMFQQLSPWIDCLHAKDRKLHTDRGVPAGQGDLDYQQLVTLAARHTSHAPLILEYVGPKDYKDALAHLRRALRQAGLVERPTAPER